MFSKTLINDTIDFFLPNICEVCGIKLHNDELLLCNSCRTLIKKVTPLRIQFAFEENFGENDIISGLYSLYLFEKEKEFQKVIHHLKYGSRFRIGIILGKEIYKAGSDIIKSWGIDLITPVPLHKLREAERGYNQAYMIAKGIGKNGSIKIAKNAIRRKRYTQTQTHLDHDQRKENLSNAFEVKDKNLIKGKSILIVDDVITTGATIQECARAFIEAGASKIYAASAALAG